MDVKGMHYDFKQKLNKIDSQQYRNLRIPEIDWKLNEAYEIFVKNIAEPRLNNYFGFELNQRSIDDIKTVVVDAQVLIAKKISDTEYIVTLPDNYMFYISSKVILEREGCESRLSKKCFVRQHDDDFYNSSFDISSFEWREVNITFFENKIKIHTDGTFSIKELRLDYIRKHAYIHNAQDFLPTGSYKLPSGEILTGTQNCELPEHTHREIVDIAVLITSGDLSMADYQIKQAKINLNQFN